MQVTLILAWLTIIFLGEVVIVFINADMMEKIEIKFQRSSVETEA